MKSHWRFHATLRRRNQKKCVRRCRPLNITNHNSRCTFGPVVHIIGDIPAFACLVSVCLHSLRNTFEYTSYAITSMRISLVRSHDIVKGGLYRSTSN